MTIINYFRRFSWVNFDSAHTIFNLHPCCMKNAPVFSQLDAHNFFKYIINRSKIDSYSLLCGISLNIVEVCVQLILKLLSFSYFLLGHSNLLSHSSSVLCLLYRCGLCGQLYMSAPEMVSTSWSQIVWTVAWLIKNSDRMMHLIFVRLNLDGNLYIWPHWLCWHKSISPFPFIPFYAGQAGYLEVCSIALVIHSKQV